MATGLGKTVLFSLIAQRWASRVLVLAHRDELIAQARDELEGILSRKVEIERADDWASLSRGDNSNLFGSDVSPVVVGSVQTMCQPNRLERWPRDEFGLIVVDEAHHATANSYRRILEYFPAKRLGVTATPQRADKLALGSVFGSVAYEMGIAEAVEAGWLVPVEQRYVTVRDLDLSTVGTVGDDFAQGSLGHALTGDAVLDRMVAATVELCGEEPTLIFTAPRSPEDDVSQGELFADALNKIKPCRAVFLSGETDRDVRRREVAAFEAGERQYLVGCALFTEGFNSPAIARIVMARPTKSVVYYTQAIGRGTRSLRGTLQPHHDTPESRRAAIAESGKPSVLVIDFVGNSGRHKLVSTVDIFAGEQPPGVIERAKRMALDSARPVREILDEAEAEERREREEAQRRAAERQERRERAARVRVNRVDIESHSVNPFEYTDGVSGRERRSPASSSSPATASQRAWIESNGGVLPKNATIGQAGEVISEINWRRKERLCSMKQEAVLRRSGLAEGPVPKAHAKACLDWLAELGWPRGHMRRPDRTRLGIVPEAGGFRLTIDRTPVGGVYPTVEDVRKTYQGLAVDTVSAAT